MFLGSQSKEFLAVFADIAKKYHTIDSSYHRIDYKDNKLISTWYSMEDLCDANNVNTEYR